MMKLTPEQLLDLAARAPLGDLCILRHPEHPDGLHDIARRSVQWALDLVAAVNEAMPEDAQPEPEAETPEPDYPWVEYPHAQWMAADSNGLVWWYSEEPSMDPDCWHPTDDSGDARMELVRTGAGSSCPHWRETKRRRPEGV